MSNKARFLITTADERIWKFDRPVIFLGEWCRFYHRKHVWEKMDAIVAEPYGLGKQKKDEDNAQARALEKKLFPELCHILNDVHGTQYNERFWKIVLGHWFRRYIAIVLNRVKTLEQCLNNYNISGSTIYNDTYYNLSTKNSTAAVWITNDERWNNALNYKILLYLGFKSLTQKKTSDDNNQSSFKPLSRGTTNKPQWLINLVSFYTSITQKLKRESNSLIISSYLTKKTVVKLQLSLKEFPQRWISPNLKINKPANNKQRDQLKSRLVKDSPDNLELICRSLFFDLLPICYLEGFDELNHQVSQLPWPTKPKFIFTSNRFDTDEIFKLWTAIKTKNGSPYIVGQHGNSYGTSRYMHPSIEEITSDKFLTWGWADGLPQHTSAFILKTARKKFNRYNPKGVLLLIEYVTTHRIYTWDSVHEFSQYFLEQQVFVTNLDRLPRKNLIIRLHGTHKYSNWNEEARWQDFDPKINIEDGSASINQLINQSRLVVHSYDSTGILETLSQNIPTLAFWQNGFDHLRESAKPSYQLLVDAEIIHLSPESIAKKVNDIWDSIDDWWSQPIVQNARKEFCSKYAKTNMSPVNDLKKILLE